MVFLNPEGVALCLPLARASGTEGYCRFLKPPNGGDRVGLQAALPEAICRPHSGAYGFSHSPLTTGLRQWQEELHPFGVKCRRSKESWFSLPNLDRR
jgi:hypothetical protein